MQTAAATVANAKCMQKPYTNTIAIFTCIAKKPCHMTGVICLLMVNNPRHKGWHFPYLNQSQYTPPFPNNISHTCACTVMCELRIAHVTMGCALLHMLCT